MLLFAPVALAQEATSSSKTATISATVLSAKKEATPTSVLDKLSELKKEIASKAAKLKEEVNKKMENKALVGQVLEITESRINLKTKTSTKFININEFTNYQDGPQTTKTSKIAFKDIEKDDLVAALGDVDDKEVLNAKKIVKLDKTIYEISKKKFYWGQVQSITGNIINLKTRENPEVKLVTSNNTSYQMGNDEATLATIKPNRFIISLGSTNSKNQNISEFIYILTNGGILKPDLKTASPSTSAK